MTPAKIDETHHPRRTSWVQEANGHPEFPIQNLPLGIFSPPEGEPRAGVAIGDRILDLTRIGTLLSAALAPALDTGTLNALFALPASDRAALRHQLSALLSEDGHRDAVEPALHRAGDCTLHLPATIGDYTDFYVGIHHATNVGSLFRPDNPLLPNYKHVPIGYHGRASSVRPSGVPVIRPNGQYKGPDATRPSFGPTNRLDYELELGVWIGQGNPLGTPIPIGAAAGHIAGLCLLNDWSARDFQAWEYQPLGPFLAKNFQTTISPWVITAEALAPFRIAQPARPGGDPRPLAYLWDDADQTSGAFAIELDVSILTETMRKMGVPAHRLSHAAASNMYWTIAQIVTHHASNGCNLNPGDLLGTGTISAPGRDGMGSLLEISQGGAQPITLPTGETRSFVEDGDEILLAAHANRDGFVPIGFGGCRAVILPAKAQP
jgi:fumarylacetoacetase